MSVPLSRRGALAAGATAAAAVLWPGLSARADTRHRSNRVDFMLNAETLDGGEQVTALTLETSHLGPIRAQDLSTSTFTVHATATSPLPDYSGSRIASEYDLDRTVTRARLDRHGRIVLDLAYAEGQVGGATLGYVIALGRNVRMNLTYTVTQTAPIGLRGGGELADLELTQTDLVNPEVDAFDRGVSASGLKYRLFRSNRAGRRPLVVWLHGGGEGASLPNNYYDNETTLRANRGALGFATDRAQRIFGGAHVVVPQSTSYWLADGDGFAPLIREVIEEVPGVDRERIYVVGCSNGGYLSLKLTTVFADLFAASVPICGVVAGDPPMIADADLAAITTPTWLVASLDDTTVDPQANTVHAHELIPNSKVTLYQDVTWNGYQFPGHWSWIYVARDDPSIDGTHIWEWLAGQRR